MSLTAERPASAETRCRIMETAERLFRTLGYQKTTVADIAKTLKMSPANVYRFFESKKAINEAVAERLMGEVEAAILAIAEGDAPATERLTDMIRTLHGMSVSLYTEEQRMHEMVEVALSESWDVVLGHVHRKAAAFHKVVADGAASGEFRVDDPEAASWCVQVSLMRFFHPTILVQCADGPGPTLEQMIGFVLKGLGAKQGG